MSEDLKQTPPASIESDAPSEYMRGYSDGLAQAEVVYQLSETDIYDFAGWLTTRKTVVEAGSSKEAGPMAEAVGEYIHTFPERFTAQETIAAAIQRARYEAIEVCAKLCDLHQKMRETTGHPREASSARKLAAAMRSVYENAR